MSEAKNILLTLNVDISKSVESMAEYEDAIEGVSIKIAELQTKQKKGTPLNEGERKELLRLKEVKKALQREYSDQSRQVQNAIVAETKYKDTLKGLCAQLSTAKDQLRTMKDAGSPEWQKQAEEVNALNEKIKAMEQSYGVFSRNVGNYESVLKSQNEIIAESARKVAELMQAGKMNSEEFQEAQKVISDYGKEVEDTGRNGIEAMNSSLGGLVGAMTLVSTMMGEDTEEAKKMNEIIKKVSIAVSAMSIAMQLYDAAQKKGIITKITYNLQIKTATKALQAEAVAEAGSTKAKIAGKVAQDALNKSMLANPVMLVVAAVAALVAGLTALVVWLVRSTDEQQAASKAQKEYERQCLDTETAVSRLSAEEARRATEISKAYQDEIIALRKKGASEEQVNKKMREMEDALTNNTIAATEKRIKESQKELSSAKTNLDAQVELYEKLVRTKGKDAKKTKEQYTVMQEAKKAYHDLYASIQADVKSINDANYQMATSSADASKEAADKAYEVWNSHFDAVSAIQQSVLNMKKTYYKDYSKSEDENRILEFQHNQKWEAKNFELHRAQTLKKLEYDRKTGKITEQEYRDQLAVLAAARDEFYLGQSDALVEFSRSVVESAVSLAGGRGLDNQLNDVREKFRLAEEAIRNDTLMSEEEKSFLLMNLAAERERQIQATREAFNEKTNSNILESINRLYKDDERQFSESEEEFLSMEIERLEKLIAERKKAGLATLEDESALEVLKYQFRVAGMNRELSLAWKSAEEQYNIKKKFIEDELALDNLSAERRAELEKELAELNSDYQQQKIDKFTEYASQCIEIVNSLNEVMNNIGDAQVQKEEQENNEKKAALEKRLDAGLISQKEYDKEVEKMDADLDKKKAEIERKAAIRQKAISAMQIAINTATAIMKIWAEVPKVDFGASTAVLTAVAAAVGAAQLAAVLSEPLPQARKGGLVQGPTHEGGGVLVNTEGGERIVSANPSKVFPELLNLISWIGKHSSIPDTGYSTHVLAKSSGPESKAMDYELLSDMIALKMSGAIKDLKIYTAITDVREADENYTKIENSAKI